MAWSTIEAPAGLEAPRPLVVRAQSIPPRHEFPEHAHAWHQVVYATTGVLTAAVEGRTFVISPEQAVWLPEGTRHRVGTLFGAEFRSLWIASELGADLGTTPRIFKASALLQALIIEAAALDDPGEDDGYRSRVTNLIIDQLRRAQSLPGALPWPTSPSIMRLCEALYSNPADGRRPEDWGKALAMSPRTLGRRFEAELGMSMRTWRRRLRLFRAIEMLGGGMGVTATAMALGYGSTSAFVYAFRREMGVSPGAYLRDPSPVHRKAR